MAQVTRAMFYDRARRICEDIIKVATYCKEQVADARGNTPADKMGARATNDEIDQIIRLDWILGYIQRESESLGVTYAKK